MKEMTVNSKIIKSVFFNQTDGQLYIEFRNGETRLFDGVTETAACELVAAPSPGQHYIDRIRTQYRRVA